MPHDLVPPPLPLRKTPPKRSTLRHQVLQLSMEELAKGSLLVRVGAALSTLVVLGVSGLAYLLVADAYDIYPQLAYRAIFQSSAYSSHCRSHSSSVSSRCASTRYRYSS